jgi:hypothetical protein
MPEYSRSAGSGGVGFSEMVLVLTPETSVLRPVR